MGACSLAALCTCGGEEFPYFIPGTATLPACTEAPDFDLSGRWTEGAGAVSIRTAGCDNAEPGSERTSCALGWAMMQTGAEVEILVDEEYRILGRLCGATLHLEGGWWLPVQDGGQCTYEEDSAAEVGIQREGSTLTVSREEGSNVLVARGRLEVRGPCDAAYDITLFQSR